MAKANKKDIPALFIRTKHATAAYRRAGFVFNRVPYGIALDALDKAQIVLLKSDPHLVVEERTFPADEAPGDNKLTQVLLGSSILPARIQLADDVEVAQDDIVAMVFAAVAANPDIAVISADDWNAEAFNELREKFLQETVEALKADPAPFQEFMALREKAAKADKTVKPAKVDKTLKPAKVDKTDKTAGKK